MPREGSLTSADLIGKLDVLRVECKKCGRSGRYRVDRLVQQVGRDAKLTDWLTNLSADCPRRCRQQSRNRNHENVPPHDSLPNCR
jgi:hypothetical protein